MVFYGIVEFKDDLVFKKMVDDVVIDFMKSGQFVVFYDKYFNLLILFYGFNFKLLMSVVFKCVLVNLIDFGDFVVYE